MVEFIQIGANNDDILGGWVGLGLGPIELAIKWACLGGVHNTTNSYWSKL